MISKDQIFESFRWLVNLPQTSWKFIFRCFQNSGTPEWMVYNGKPYYLMDDLGVPLFLETSKHQMIVGNPGDFSTNP